VGGAATANEDARRRRPVLGKGRRESRESGIVVSLTAQAASGIMVTKLS
jgi:hypothetical protein